MGLFLGWKQIFRTHNFKITISSVDNFQKKFKFQTPSYPIIVMLITIAFIT